MMRHLIFAAVLSALSLPALAAPTCAGRDLLTDLPESERAELEAVIAKDPYATGNWWRAEKGGSVIDVVGTFHMDDPRHDAFAARLEPVIAAADTVYLEATEVEMKALQAEIGRNPALMFITTGPTLPEQLPEAEWQALAAEMTLRGIPAFMASKFRPWYLMVLLSMPPCAMEALQGKSEGLDARIQAMAKADGVPLAALEPFDTIFGIFALMDSADQIALVRAALPMAAQSEDMFATMTAAYFRGEHRLIWEFSRMAALKAPGMTPEDAAREFGRMEEALLTGRNRAWMKVILPAAAGHRIVVAAGAAHLSGPDGVLALLATAGYRLTRQD
jgi:uncharacterized protein